jgi:hypothetical protein
MKHRSPARFRRLAGSMPAAAILALLCFSSAPAQSSPPPTLDEILQQLEKNLHAYDAKVPSLFCNEHVVSRIDPSQLHGNTVTDSIFRLKRTANPDLSTHLEESRDIKSVDGRPATGETIYGPAILQGAFSGGVATVSLEQQACMSYKLEPIKRAGKPYVVEFTSIYKRDHPPNCILQEDGHGRVFIDPATMQIKRMELTAPNHTMAYPMDATGYTPPPVTGVWIITIDYAPVPLGGQTFWLPATVTSSMTGITPSMTRLSPSHSTTWSFNAHYTNYHKLEVTSRIVVPTDTPEDHQ